MNVCCVARATLFFSSGFAFRLEILMGPIDLKYLAGTVPLRGVTIFAQCQNPQSYETLVYPATRLY
jgi:hypothetical protein